MHKTLSEVERIMTQDSNYSDPELLKGLASNVTGTFEQLVNTYDPQLRNFVKHKTECEESTKDIMQDCWLDVFKALNRYSKERILALALRSWLFTIARNKTFTHLNKRNRDMSKTTSIQSFKDNSWEPACEPQLEDIAKMKSQATFMRIAIEQLPPRSKTVLKLFLLEELTYEEMAQQLQQPVGTIRTAVSRALKLLQKMLTTNIY